MMLFYQFSRYAKEDLLTDIREFKVIEAARKLKAYVMRFKNHCY